MSKKQELYKNELKAEKNRKSTNHSFNKKVLHWSYCSGCGLVLLKNEATLKAASLPCYD